MRVWLSWFAVMALGACGEPGAASPTTPKQLPPDKTEVTMERSDGPVPPVRETAPAASSAAPLITATPNANFGGSSAPEKDLADDPNLGGPQQPAVEKAVAPARPRMAACYKRAKEADPSIGGNALFDVTIGKDGKPATVRLAKREGLSESMVGCLVTAVKGMTFEPGAKSHVIPLVFGSAPAAADAGAPKK